jgi:hypothetical protein
MVHDVPGHCADVNMYSVPGASRTVPGAGLFVPSRVDSAGAWREVLPVT